MEVHENRTDLERLLAVAWEYEHRRPWRSRLLKWLLPFALSAAVFSIYAFSDVYTAVTSALAPTEATRTVDAIAAANVEEDIDFRIAQRAKSLPGWQAFLEAHRDGPHAEAAHAEIERLSPAPRRQPDPRERDLDAQASRAEVGQALLAEKTSSPSAASEVSDGASQDARTESGVVARGAAANEVAALTSDGTCKRDANRLERLRGSPKSDEASRFANDFGCEKLRTQPSALMQNLARAPSAQVVAHPKPPVEVGSASAHVPSAPAGAHPRPFVELGSASAHARSAPAAAHPRPSEESGLALSQERRAPVRPDRTRWTASHSTEPTPYANTRRVADQRTQYLVTMWLECPVDETGDRPPSQGCLLSERP
jgi:hypothetical protein